MYRLTSRLADGIQKGKKDAGYLGSRFYQPTNEVHVRREIFALVCCAELTLFIVYPTPLELMSTFMSKAGTL